MRKQYLTVKEIAEMLSVTDHYVRQLIASGKIPAIKIGTIYRVNEVEFKAYLEKAKVAA